MDLLLEQMEYLNHYYIKKVNNILQQMGGFIFEFLELVLQYNNLFQKHVERLNQGIQKIGEGMQDVGSKVASFKDSFQKD